jgi:hypothetical protein
MVLQIQLPPEAEARLRERAATSGQDIASYAAQLLQEAVVTPSMDELLAPFRKQVEASDMSAEELDDLFEGLRDKVWRDRQARQAKST